MNIDYGIRPYGANKFANFGILKKSFWVKNLHIWSDLREIWHDVGGFWFPLTIKFGANWWNVSPPWGEKPQNRSVTNFNTGDPVGKNCRFITTCKAHHCVSNIKQQKIKFITSRAADIIWSFYYTRGPWGDEINFCCYFVSQRWT